MKEALRRTGLLPPNDEFFTPRNAVLPLLEYLETDRHPPSCREFPGDGNKIIYWEPCATGGKSGIASAMREYDYAVIATEYEKLDFLTDEPDFDFDVIVTNPPYSQKDAFIRRCYELGKPWAMLMPITALEGITRGDLFREHGVELLVLDRRVQFQNGKKGCWFNTSWFCHGLLPDRLVFGKLEGDSR